MEQLRTNRYYYRQVYYKPTKTDNYKINNTIISDFYGMDSSIQYLIGIDTSSKYH